jgi:nitrogen regulatory protein PII
VTTAWEGDEEMKTDNHEVVFAIVNAGFAEDVMDVAREQGVRGGTILNARGVVNEDAAAFFGITLHADKEILMMVVEKDIRDNVLNAIYKEMGMAKKAKGIAFSLPVSDVAGLAPKIEQKLETE